MFEVRDKVVLVTGSSAGIGAEVVRGLVKEGAKHVAILDLDLKGQALADELNSKHGPNRVKFYKCDVTSQDLHDSYDDVIKNFDYIDVVVNNAGLMNDGPKVYEKQIAVNVTALITSSLKAFNLMRKDRKGKGGAIINISSIIALSQSRGLPIYAATKSAVLQFSNGMGMEPHYSATGVRVIAICFGFTKTTLFSETKMEAFDKETNELLEKSLDNFTYQTPESAAAGVIEVLKKATSGSTWVVSDNRPAVDISENLQEAYKMMNRGINYK